MGLAEYNKDIMADFMPLISPVPDVVNKEIASCGDAMTKALCLSIKKSCKRAPKK